MDWIIQGTHAPFFVAQQKGYYKDAGLNVQIDAGKGATNVAVSVAGGVYDFGWVDMKEYKGSPALDAGLLAAAQAVEHYEISRYGTLKTWANELGLSGAVGLLDQTLAEEKKTDATLTEIAESAVNRKAEAA